MDPLLLAVSIVYFAPALAAVVCFLTSLWFAFRMFMHLRPGRNFGAFIVGPAVFATETFYTTEGVPYFRLFQIWFRRFAYFLFGEGVVVLLTYLITFVEGKHVL